MNTTTSIMEFDLFLEESSILFWIDDSEYVLYGEKGLFVWTDYQNKDESANSSLSRLAQRIRNEQKENGFNPTPLWEGWRNLELAMREDLGDDIFDSFLSVGGHLFADRETMNTIDVFVDTSADAMVGGDNWGLCDSAASVRKFIAQVAAKVASVYDGYEIEIHEVDHGFKVEIVDERAESEILNKFGYDEDRIRSIMMEVWEKQDWYVCD